MATFNGTDRNTCPNMSEPQDQDAWNTFIEYGTTPDSGTIDPSFGTSDFNRECFNICETGTIDPQGEPEISHYIDQNGICQLCPNPGETDAINDLGDMAEMCANLPAGQVDVPGTSDKTWFIRHQEFNLRRDFLNRIDWTSTATDGPSTYWLNSDGPLTDTEILRRIGIRRPGTTQYSLPNGYNNIGELRSAINEGRGSVVVCQDDNRPEWIPVDQADQIADEQRGSWRTDPIPGEDYIQYPLCIVKDGISYFGPDHIITEEVQDFIIEMNNEESTRDTGLVSSVVQSFSELLSGISGDSTFEACVNDKLNTNDDDSEIQSRIASYDTLSQFSNEDINYLKRKLRRIVVIRTDDVNECMNLLNLGQSVCTTGVADKTLQIGRLIFSIVGNDRINVLDMDNDERIKLNKMIDELGPLIPQAIKNIIHVSKEYETRICNVPSNTTLLLERVYTDLYDKPTNIQFDISPYIDFNSLINIDDNVRFIKTLVVLIVFSYLFMHFANILVAFLSRGALKTEL